MTEKISPALLEQAVDWMVTLESGDVTEQEHSKFLAWLAQAPQHLQAWQAITQRVVEPIADIKQLKLDDQNTLIESTLLRPSNRRQFLQKSLAFAGVSLGVASLLERVTPLSGMAADYATATSERKTVLLADDSEVILNARTHFDLHITHQLREIILHQGEIIVTQAQTSPLQRLTRCQQGLVDCQQGRFLLKQKSTSSFVLALQGTINVTTNIGKKVTLSQGQGVTFSDIEIGKVEDNLAYKTKWQQGMHLAKNETLASVITAIENYYPGIIHLASEVQNIKVYGGYPLDDLDKSFAILAESLPIAVRKLGSIAVFITQKQKN